MEGRKRKKQDSPVFEIFVVLAIVAIVAITGQVLLHLDNNGSESITGFSVAENPVEASFKDFIDVGVDDIVVNPPTPLIGEPFEITILISNQGFSDINQPFYLEVKLVPNGENVKPTIVNPVMTEALEPGEKTKSLIKVTMVNKEGPMRILVTADSTGKLDDDNPSNNKRSKTIIVTSQ